MKKTHKTSSETQTMAIAAELAATLKGPEIILLHGNLGAGKTVFVRGLAQALGISKTITSPTYTLMKVYPTDKKDITSLVHLDAYRVSGKDLLNIGLTEYIERPDTVVIIEWGEKVKDFVAGLANVININIETGTKDNQRKITIS